MSSVHQTKPGIEDLLDRWTTRGLITAEQADLIREDASSESNVAGTALTHVSRRQSLIAEALGYLGGVLIVVAASLITQEYWSDIPTWGRLALPTTAAVLLLAAGWVAYRQQSALTRRLRAVLWLASTSAAAFALWVVGRYVLRWRVEEDIALLVGVGTAALASVLWLFHRTFVQQVALFAALVVTVTAAAVHLEENQPAPTGLALWGLGSIWLALGWGGLLRPRGAVYGLGAGAFLVGAMTTMPAGDWGYVFALISVAALVSLAVVLGDLFMLGIAAFGALIVLPASVTHFFPGALAAPLAVLVTGIVLVLAALRTIRRRKRVPSRRTTRDRTGNRPVAIGVACGGALLATLAALFVGFTK
jgi:hypothetical protein